MYVLKAKRMIEFDRCSNKEARVVAEDQERLWAWDFLLFWRKDKKIHISDIIWEETFSLCSMFCVFCLFLFDTGYLVTQADLELPTLLSLPPKG